MNKRRLNLLIVAVVCVVLGVVYNNFFSRTTIATLNFPDFTVEKLIRSNDNSFIKIESVDLDDVERISNYDMVLVRIHGASLTAKHLDAIKAAIADGVPVYSTEKSNADINSLKGRELDYIATLMDNGSVKNYRSMFHYIRKNIDRKYIFNGDYEEPVLVPEDYFFHLGEDEFFSTYEEYQKFYEQKGYYKQGAPRVALLSGNINMQNSNEEHMVALIKSLEEKGLNVYPINSFGMKKLGMIASVKPNAIINRPHGRLVMGGGEAGTEMLKQMNVPILAPVTVSELHDKWMDSKQGLTSGGMTSMSVVMPELDGAIAPFAIAAQFERNGRNLFDAIPGHTEKFCRLVKNFTELQSKPNAEKKIAIYYYKGTGKGSVGAADIEGVQSLYNTLKMLKQNGYKVENLPANAYALEAEIQKSGSVLGTYALGAYDTFLKEGNPALVDVDTFAAWCEEQLPEKLIADMKARYGEAPGEYMAAEVDGKKAIAVARLEFGNVAILPQPMPSVGEDVDKLVHGVDGAPAYPYVASYMWTRNAFKADAMIHFGTHGSLEFIPGKQIALSDYDWTDALVADMPHFYLYTISNIGEGIIAKRRSYATLVDHMTAPFMQGETYGELEQLHQAISNYETIDNPNVKEQYAHTIMGLAKSQNIFSALGIDSTRLVTAEDIHRIHMYVEEIDGAKVNDGLYTLGVPYTKEEIANTARLMNVDAVSYGLASVDRARGRMTDKEMKDVSYVAHRYGAQTNRVIARVFAGTSPEVIFEEIVGAKNKADYDAQIAKEEQTQQMKKMMMMRMMKAKPKKDMPKFFDEQHRLVELPEEEKDEMPNMGGSMMDRMASAKPAGVGAQGDDERSMMVAMRILHDALVKIADTQSNLAKSTRMEQEALVDALNGGYVETGSAGDPIINSQSVPTGKNFYSINPETTPSNEAWKVGKRLAEDLLEAEFKSKGKYPEKVSFTLWATDFISSEGATVAQILYLLGVEPLRDGFGYIRSLQLIPEEQLGRPRVDVVIQTSGQLRDIAASRLELINRAVDMAGAAEDKGTNFVKKGLADAERRLLEKGFSPVEARKFSRERIFGGSGYGTGIMGMVESGDSWENRSEIAERYISNMSAVYSSNGGEDWGAVRQGVFEAALLNTEVVVQPRASNTWGPLSLDHVYEFMGGMSAAVKQVTGNDPTGYFNDFRNSSRARVQELKEAIGVETNSTIFNPKYIKEMFKGEASAMDSFAETFRNTYGWNAMKPSAIDQHIWNKYYDIYVKDELKLGVKEKFTEKNPYALQEMTAVMMESARKGMWQATAEQLKDVAQLHGELVKEHTAGCSGFICDNQKLREFIAQNLTPEAAASYKKEIKAAREVALDEAQQQNNVVLKKDEQQAQKQRQNEQASPEEKANYTLYYVLGALVVLIGGWIVIKKRMRR